MELPFIASESARLISIVQVIIARFLKGAWLGFLALPLSLSFIRRLLCNPPGLDLNSLLAGTAQAGFVLGLVLSIGVLL
jgi:uncharacterized RDD family membrane protein YckC